MGAFLSAIGIIGLIVGIVLLIVGLITKDKLKGGIVAIISAVIFIIGIIITPSEEGNSATSGESEIEEVSNDESTNEDYEQEVEETVVEEEPVELTPQEKMLADLLLLIEEGKAFDSGSYIKGDIPKGEYAFITFDGSGQYYSEEDAAGNIIGNENFDSFGYVQVHEAGNIEARGALVKVDALNELGVSGAKELYEILNDLEDYKDAGWYKVGVDIEPGQYIIESYGEGYAAVMSGPIGNDEIIDNNLFNGRYSVNITDGQYLVVSNGTITQ